MFYVHIQSFIIYLYVYIYVYIQKDYRKTEREREREREGGAGRYQQYCVHVPEVLVRSRIQKKLFGLSFHRTNWTIWVSAQHAVFLGLRSETLFSRSMYILGPECFDMPRHTSNIFCSHLSQTISFVGN